MGPWRVTTARPAIDTAIQPVSHVQTSDVMYAPVAKSPRTAIGNARPILPATLPHGIAPASVSALRSWKMHTRRIDAAPIPMKSESKCR
jgi:hypothetical protein